MIFNVTTAFSTRARFWPLAQMPHNLIWSLISSDWWNFSETLVSSEAWDSRDRQITSHLRSWFSPAISTPWIWLLPTNFTASSKFLHFNQSKLNFKLSEVVRNFASGPRSESGFRTVLKIALSQESWAKGKVDDCICIPRFLMGMKQEEIYFIISDCLYSIAFNKNV